MKRLLSAACLCLMFTCGQTVSAQSRDALPPPSNDNELPNIDRVETLPISRNRNQFDFGNFDRNQGIGGIAPGVRQSPMQAAINELKQADNDKDKSAAKEKIKAELAKQYDAFLSKDQTRVDQLFDRLKKLEEQLEKRKAAKERLVELKLEMMVSQAEGLGWPTDNPLSQNHFAPRAHNLTQPGPLRSNIQNPAFPGMQNRGNTFNPDPESLPQPSNFGFQNRPRSNRDNQLK